MCQPRLQRQRQRQRQRQHREHNRQHNVTRGSSEGRTHSSSNLAVGSSQSSKSTEYCQRGRKGCVGSAQQGHFPSRKLSEVASGPDPDHPACHSTVSHRAPAPPEGGAASERAAWGEAAGIAGLDCGGAPWPATRRRCAAAGRWAWQVWRPLQAVVVHLSSHQEVITFVRLITSCAHD
jgi:hypothetical protein